MVISYMDTSGGKISSYRHSAPCTPAYEGEPIWCITQRYNTVGTENDILEPGEQFTLLVTTPSTATPDSRITVNMQLAGGTTTSIQRKVPPALNDYQILI